MSDFAAERQGRMPFAVLLEAAESDSRARGNDRSGGGRASRPNG